MSAFGTKQDCGCRSSVWPEAEVLRTRIEGLKNPRGEAAFDPKETSAASVNFLPDADALVGRPPFPSRPVYSLGLLLWALLTCSMT